MWAGGTFSQAGSLHVRCSGSWQVLPLLIHGRPAAESSLHGWVHAALPNIQYYNRACIGMAAMFCCHSRLKLALAPRSAHKEPKWTDSYITNSALAVIAREATASSGHHGCIVATSCSCDVYQPCSAAALDVFYLQRECSHPYPHPEM